jgi:hypothetical protein
MTLLQEVLVLIAKADDSVLLKVKGLLNEDHEYEAWLCEQLLMRPLTKASILYSEESGLSISQAFEAVRAFLAGDGINIPQRPENSSFTG